MALELDLVERIAATDAATWDVLVRGDGPFLSRAYLAALERGLPANVTPRYGVLRRGPVPIAALMAQIVDVDAEDALPAHAPSGAGRKRHLAASAALRAVDARFLLVGNYLAWGVPGVALSPQVSAAEGWHDVAAGIALLCERDPRAARAHAQLVLDVGAAHAPHAAAALDGFLRFESEPDMVLALEPAWRTYADYLGALNRKYRKAAKDMDKDLAAGGCRLVRGLGVTPEIAARLHALYEDVHARNRFRFVTASPSFVPELARELGDRFRVNAIARGGDVLAFGSTINGGDTAIAYLVGHDADENAELPLYLRLLLAAVEDGIELRCRRVTFGRTALEPKARVGAQPQALAVFGRATSPLLAPFVPLLARVTPKTAPPVRKPFKE